jgi:hypothetical protein
MQMFELSNVFFFLAAKLGDNFSSRMHLGHQGPMLLVVDLPCLAPRQSHVECKSCLRNIQEGVHKHLSNQRCGPRGDQRVEFPPLSSSGLLAWLEEPLCLSAFGSCGWGCSTCCLLSARCCCVSNCFLWTTTEGCLDVDNRNAMSIWASSLALLFVVT